jgi:predicted protein tyrosine phosphatase
MKVWVLMKQHFDELMRSQKITDENVHERKDVFFISINDSTGTDEVPYFKDAENVKVLFFDDVDEDLHIPILGTSEFQTAKAMTDLQAEALFSFIRANKDKKTCIVHCAAGISRSGAVGTFINDYMQGDYAEFKKNNPYIHPNSHVLSTLRKIEHNTNN